ncbi:MAG: hypothetical protein BECKG1743E_GA0114224_112232 [Candidatus Kentron sp. G]|nr:MAG: hypothetical protein BECKG1743E_GA0114224_112232 [Candidatus Kentron sp. G]
MRKDGTISYGGQLFEVPYELSGQTIHVLVDPHRKTVVGIENEQGQSLGGVTALDAVANSHRPRAKPATGPTPKPAQSTGLNPVESAYRRHYDNDGLPE